MGYWVYWTQYHFTEFTYNNVYLQLSSMLQSNFRLEHWGFVIGNDEDNLACIERCPKMPTGCKTNRMPYTKDLMKALIIMVEFGAADKLGHDDTDMSWFLEALEEVNAKKPLVSYEQQKTYFLSIV
jgi:hypothetical protein